MLINRQEHEKGVPPAARLKPLALATLALAAALAPVWSAPEDEQQRPSTAMPATPEKLDDAEALRQWREIDGRLLDLAGDLNELEKRKRGLDEELGRAREKFAPDDIGPASVFARRGLSRLSSQMDQNLREERRLREEIVEIGVRAHGVRDQIRPRLEALRGELDARKKLSPEDKRDLERARAWLEGMSGSPGPQGMLRKIYGPRLLSESRRGEPPRPRGPRPNKPRPAPEGQPGQPPHEASDHAPEFAPDLPPPDQDLQERYERRLQKLEAEVRALRKEVEALRKANHPREERP